MTKESPGGLETCLWSSKAAPAREPALDPPLSTARRILASCRLVATHGPLHDGPGNESVGVSPCKEKLRHLPNGLKVTDCRHQAKHQQMVNLRNRKQTLFISVQQSFCKLWVANCHHCFARLPGRVLKPLGQHASPAQSCTYASKQMVRRQAPVK